MNILLPGRDDYTGPTTGTFSFPHHQKLYEESHNVMERVAYINREKPKREIWIRLHNIMYLDPAVCPAITKCATLDADYKTKRAPLDAEILAYIKTKIPDCAWDGQTLVFPK
mgnify:CR=1 FL=1